MSSQKIRTLLSGEIPISVKSAQAFHSGRLNTGRTISLHKGHSLTLSAQPFR